MASQLTKAIVDNTELADELEISSQTREQIRDDAKKLENPVEHAGEKVDVSTMKPVIGTVEQNAHRSKVYWETRTTEIGRVESVVSDLDGSVDTRTQHESRAKERKHERAEPDGDETQETRGLKVPASRTGRLYSAAHFGSEAHAQQETLPAEQRLTEAQTIAANVVFFANSGDVTGNTDNLRTPTEVARVAAITPLVEQAIADVDHGDNETQQSINTKAHEEFATVMTQNSQSGRPTRSMRIAVATDEKLQEEVKKKEQAKENTTSAKAAYEAARTAREQLDSLPVTQRTYSVVNRAGRQEEVLKEKGEEYVIPTPQNAHPGPPLRTETPAETKHSSARRLQSDVSAPSPAEQQRLPEQNPQTEAWLTEREASLRYESNETGDTLAKEMVTVIRDEGLEYNQMNGAYLQSLYDQRVQDLAQQPENQALRQRVARLGRVLNYQQHYNIPKPKFGNPQQQKLSDLTSREQNVDPPDFTEYLDLNVAGKNSVNLAQEALNIMKRLRVGAKVLDKSNRETLLDTPPSGYTQDSIRELLKPVRQFRVLKSNGSDRRNQYD